MKSPKSSSFKTIYPVSLGCPKNKSDFEKLLYVLQKRGCQFTFDPAEADTFWINTCAFIRPAVEEAIEHILELAQLKRPHQKLIVSGCLPARYSEGELKELLPEVDEFYGIEPYHYFAEEEPTEKILTESPFYAYLKISEGCNHRCSYCTIPKIRGPFRSKPKELLLKETENLLKQGVKELILVGQDITFYGKDLGKSEGLLELLKELLLLPYEFRVRLLYLHLSHLSKSFIKELLCLPKVLPYFDIPIQHAHPQVLKKMRRFYEPEQILDIIDFIRKENPYASIRTTIITGFPGEGEKEFLYLLEFLNKAKFDYLGVFTFYPEEGTPASKFGEKVPYKEKLRRKREILRLQREITKERLKERVGLEEEVLILGFNGKNKYFGISRMQAPVIDGITYIPVKGSYVINPGDLLKVRLIKSGVYDLWGVPLDFKG
ncbi:MAG: 30S ribosomal protein S12 methylthiotransferase RimO [Caldimicrobium sp.]